MGSETSIRASRWSAWFIATAPLAVSWIAIAALSFQIRQDAEVVAVAFPPWWDVQQTFEAAASADAAIVRITGIPAVLVVRPDNRAGLKRLREAGAWLTIDPRAIAGCL
jgi:hypothetical protein